MDEKQIKEKLQTLLKEQPLDYNKIVALSNELAKLDPNSVRFTVDADLVSRLGNELVARQETALSELIKNAYDADATKVSIRFVDTDEVGGTLIVEDNGTGMDREQLIDGFMRISSNMKKEKPFSDLYNRKKAGRKGIGRFAVQRLGNKLEIMTKTADATDSYDVKFDWSDYQASKNINEISNTVLMVPAHTQINGTTLVMTDLKDKWSVAAIKHVYSYLDDILQPVSEFNVNDNKGGFDLIVEKEVNGEVTIIENESQHFEKYAVATIWGKVDDNGFATFHIDSKELGFVHDEQLGFDLDNANTPFTLLKNVRVKAYYYLEQYLPKSQKTAIRKYLQRSGSIRLYRNGYRVLPYGEPSNDWLKLDESLRRRSILPQHGNNNFEGVINIDDNSGNFEETSSREGLVENDAFIQLQNFVYRMLVTAVIRIAKERNVKITTSQNKVDGKWQDIDLRVKNIAYSIDELDKALEANQTGSVEDRRASKKIVSKLKKDLNELRKEQKEERKRQQEERTMFRVLSSVGLTTEQFVHEIKYYLGNMVSDIDFLKTHVSAGSDEERRLKILDGNFSNFSTYVSYFDAMVANNVNRTLVPVEMRKVVRDFIKVMASDAEKSGVKFEAPEFIGYNLYTQPMHPSEWTSILFNFYTNAKKAIKRAHRIGNIRIVTGKDEKNIYLEFLDNGDGIPEGSEEIIFERFYTTSNVASLEDTDNVNSIAGSGLGLSIVRDICISNKGSVKVVAPSGAYSTCFRVEIPALSDKEIEKLV